MAVTQRQREIYAMLRAGDKSALLATAVRQAFGRMTAADLIDVTQGGADEIVQLSPELQKAILSDVASFLLGTYGLSFPTDYATRQIYASEWITDSGAPFPLSHIDDTGQAWGWLGQTWSEGGTYIPLRRNPYYQNDAWLASALANNPIRKIGLDPQEWIPYAVNPANGDLLSIGAEGGLRSYSHLLWVPGYGLIHPRSDYLQINDSDVFDMLLPVAVALIGYYIVGPILSQAWAEVTGAATVAEGGAAVASGADVVVGGAGMPPPIETFEIIETGGEFVELAPLAGDAAPYFEVIDGTGYWFNSAGEAVAAQLPEGAVVFASESLPATITAASITDTVSKVMTMSNLKTAAQAVSLIAGIYKTVAGADGKPVLQRRDTAPTTYGGLPHPAPNDQSGGFYSLLPVLAIAAVAALSGG